MGSAAVRPAEAIIEIHPTAYIAPTAVVLGDVTLGPRASVWYGAVLRGDTAPIVVGEASNLQDGTVVHVDIDRPATIGARVAVGHRVVLHGCLVEDECLIGIGSVLLNGVRVGRGSVVAAGAVVPEGMAIPPGSVVMGVPARVVRAVEAELAERIQLTWRHYVELAERHWSGTYPLARTGL